ncbi:hypothetical protein JMUB7487_27430 [Staphylococcus aureus]
MEESTRFTNGKQAITVRKIEPYFSGPVGYRVRTGGFSEYTRVMLLDSQDWVGDGWEG